MKDNLSGVSADGPHDEVFNGAVEGLFDACCNVSESRWDSSEWASSEKDPGVVLASLPLKLTLDELNG